MIQGARLQVRNEYSKLVIADGPTLVIRKEKPSIITVGIQGPQGAPGVDGVGDATYVHVQGAPSTSWTVQHDLNKKPSVSVVDSGDTVVIGDVVYVNDDRLTINFSASFAGRAYCN